MVFIGVLLIVVVVLLWEISYNIKMINNNLIEIMKFLDKTFSTKQESRG